MSSPSPEPRSQFALVDGNNFYASCELVFAPAWRGRPLVVLSNNDGCIVSRSPEARALGLPMGAPIHEQRARCRQHGVILCSSNYALYGDMSRRMQQVLAEAVPGVEPYSIDEAFLDLAGVADATALARTLRADLLRRVKLPCGIGIGPTRTLAKLANQIAKQQPCWGGVFNLADHAPDLVARVMAAWPATEVWGVGRRLGERLATHGILSVRDLQRWPPALARRHGGVLLERTVRELNGQSCLRPDQLDSPRQQILCSRSFGRRVADRDNLRAALARHVSRAAEKLRRQGSQAAYVQVLLRPAADMPRSPAGTHALVALPMPTADSIRLLRAAREGLDSLYRPGCDYRKCGVALFGLSPAGSPQPDLFARGDSPRRQRLMQTLDCINRRHGEAGLRLAGEHLGRDWHMRQAHRSPRYTTCWQELPVVSAHGH